MPTLGVNLNEYVSGKQFIKGSIDRDLFESLALNKSYLIAISGHSLKINLEDLVNGNGLKAIFSNNLKEDLEPTSFLNALVEI